MGAILWQLANFIILGAIIYFAARKPFGAYLQKRHDYLKAEISDVKVLLTQAQEKFDEYSSKIKAFDAERDALLLQAEREGKAEAEEIKVNARRASESLVRDAGEASAQRLDDVKAKLCAEYGEKIVNRAEEILKGRLTGEDRARLLKAFSTNMGNLS